MNGYLGLTTKRWNSLNLFKSMKIDGSIKNPQNNVYKIEYLEAIVDADDLSLKLFYDGNNSTNKKQQGLLNLHVAPNMASIALKASNPFIELTHDIENNDIIISNNWKIVNDNNIFTICHDANMDINNDPITTKTHLKAYRGVGNDGIINNTYGIEI
jgi:hypothetical protein